MGKHDNEKKKRFDEDYGDNIQDLKEAQKAITKKIEKAKIPCSHTNENGKLKVKFLDEGTTKVQCKRCGAIFDFRTIDMGDLRQAIAIVHNALNQVKALSDNPSEERKFIKLLGETDYNVSTLEEIYEATIRAYNKGGKKKKKNRDRDSFGSYGSSSIKFM